MQKNIIGRAMEIKRLRKYVQSPNSEFVAIYGRRRIGKTFLIRELFEGEFAFRVTGKENVTTKEQIENFCNALNFYTGEEEAAKSWAEAFALLKHHLEGLNKKKPKILFFDELPWMDMRGSHFIGALEHFWNDWASYRNDIKLIVCGSATSWMLDKVVNSRGGLHNRVTHSILLSPFSLKEVQEYFSKRGFPYYRPEIIECYMAVGGVAYYLSLFENDKSVAQNIENLCFTRGGELTEEFEKLFRSLFRRAEGHINIVTALQRKAKGMTRLELIAEAKLTNNGNLTVMLKELEECEFIRSYSPFGKTKKETMYQLIDPFTLFYFKFMKAKNSFMAGYWNKMRQTESYRTWCGYAFEIVCLNHLEEIVKALGISGCLNVPCSWSYRPQKPVTEDDADLKRGAQIDLLIDRSDNTINLCEMKYSQEKYEIDKKYDSLLAARVRTFRKVTKTRKSLVVTFITPNGLLDNVYARKVTSEVKGNELF